MAIAHQQTTSANSGTAVASLAMSSLTYTTGRTIVVCIKALSGIEEQIVREERVMEMERAMSPPILVMGRWQ
jgi:hypothetical protein